MTIVDINEIGPIHQRSQPDTLWTTINAVEQIPGVLTPLGFTFWMEPVDRAVRRAFQRLGILREDEVRFGATPDQRIGGAFFGRWVANVDEFRRLADLTPGVSGAAFENDVFGSTRPNVPRHTRRYRYPVVAVIAPVAVFKLRKEVPAAAAEMRAWWREFTVSPPRRPAVELLREAVDRTERGSALQMLAALVGQAMFDRLGELAAKAGRSDLHLALTGGYGESEEGRMVNALLGVARGDATIEEFLAHYGARCPGEVELSATSWRENPAAVEKLVQKYAAAQERPDPTAEAQARHRQRIDAERQLLANLPRLKRPAARLLMRLAKAYIPLREEGKSVLVTPIDGGRFAARARGRELVAADVIDDPEDVFFLTLAEVLGEPPTDARTLVEHRRQLDAEYKKVNVPTLWTGTPRPVRPPTDDEDPVDRVIGIAAAQGTAEGYARVLLDAVDCDDLEDGEILVCRLTDPSWATAFFFASAVVIDIGGISSHGAIVCREMGLPCVINTITGTRAIQTGDRIHVNGDTGVVTLVERAARTSA